MKRILVAEDEVTLRMLIVDMLESLDVEVEVAEDGKEALDRILKNPYDLVVLDYMMPHLTGIDVLDRIPTAVRNAFVVVMLTAKTQTKDREDAYARGVDYFMPKPFSPMELFDLVEDILYG